MKRNFIWYIIPIMVSCINGNKSDFAPAQPGVVPDNISPAIVWTANDTISSQDFVATETAEVKYIFLESNDSKSMLGGIDQIFVDDSTFTIIDNSVTEKIAVFDNAGRYLHSIGSKGKARGEFIGLGCASKTEDGNIGVIDRLSSKLIVYSPKGDVIDEFRMNKLMPQSMILSDSIILGSYPGYLNSSEYRLKWTDYEGNVINSAFPFTSGRQYVAGVLIKDSDGDVYYNYALNDTIFKIESDKISPEIVMNLHNSELTNEFIKSTESLDDRSYIRALINNDDILNLVELIKCGDKWCVYYQKGKNTIISIVSDNGKTRTNYQKSIVSHSDKTGKIMQPEKFVGYDNGCLIGYIDTEAFSLMHNTAKGEYLERLKVNSVNAPENDDDIMHYANPILCIYKLKH